MIGGRKIAQKSVIVTKVPEKWYAEEVSGERLRTLMIPTGKMKGKWRYISSLENSIRGRGFIPLNLAKFKMENQ
jgi:hypothetical protein